MQLRPLFCPLFVLSWMLAVPCSAAISAPVAEAASSPSFLRELLAIVLPLGFIIVGLLVVLRLARRRYGLTGRETALTVMQILPLGPRERIVVLRTRAGRAFAVGVTAGSVRLVTPLDEADVASPDTAVEQGGDPPA